MIDVHLAFPDADSFPVVQLPAVPRIGERLYSQERKGFFRVTDVEWNTENSTVLLELKAEAQDG